jgi:hypothetical protein
LQADTALGLKAMAQAACNDFNKKMYRHGPGVSTGVCGLHHVRFFATAICSSLIQSKTTRNAMKKPISPKDNESNQTNPNKGTPGTNRQFDQMGGNRGKQLNPNQQPVAKPTPKPAPQPVAKPSPKPAPRPAAKPTAASPFSQKPPSKKR